MNEENLGVAILSLSGVGGSGIVAADVADGLAARGHRVHLVSDRVPFRFESLDSPVGFHTASIPDAPALPKPPITLALASKLAEIVKEEALDVIHVHYAVPNAVAAQLAQGILGRSVPFVVTFHGSDVSPVGTDPAYALVTRAALLGAAAWTAPSKYLATSAEARFALPSSRRVEVVPNFVDAERFSARANGTALRPFTIVHVSNFRPVKRVADAVAAFARVREQVDARLLLVGDGPERAAVEAMVRSLGLFRSVRFLGMRHDVARWLCRSDVAIVPSASESFGLSALEALAAGLPVVATRVGGLSDVVCEGRTGFLTDVGNIQGFADHLIRLARDPQLCQRLGEAGRADAHRRFPPKRALDGYESVLRAARLQT